MIPVIALVGRPNVGKSTLFNRLTRTRDALVANFPGLTRDRKYGEAKLNDRAYIVIDTGGITGDEEGIDSPMASQSLAAIEEADAVIFLVDARSGVFGVDAELAHRLRQQNKPIFVAVNKIDGVNEDIVMADFYQLGMSNFYPIAAAHGRGVTQLIEHVLNIFLENESDPEVDFSSIKVGVIGRPNVGKSTLVNRLLGEERVVVYDQPGTTRDSIYIDYERDDTCYTLIDTAGVRRRKNVKETIEKFSIVKTLKAIDDANVVILVCDAREGIVDQDLHLLGHVISVGCGLVLVINKWDGMTADDKNEIRRDLDRKLKFIDYAEIHFISALHGSGVGHLYQSINNAYDSATRKLATNQLTRILESAVFDHQPPMIGGRRIKLRYAHTGGHNPPIIVVHGNQTGKVPVSYQRYLEKVFRRELKLTGTPVKIEFKSGDNPYTSSKGKRISQREETRKRRLAYSANIKKEKQR